MPTKMMGGMDNPNQTQRTPDTKQRMTLHKLQFKIKAVDLSRLTFKQVNRTKQTITTAIAQANRVIHLPVVMPNIEERLEQVAQAVER